MSLTNRDPVRLRLPTTEQVRRLVACPTCGAPAGRPCVRSVGAGGALLPIPTNHRARIHQARHVEAE